MRCDLSRRSLLAGLATGLAAPAARAAPEPEVPFVPTPPEVVDGMLDLAGLQPGERLVDLGSGDGRIVLAAARRGARALGVELDAALVARARYRAQLESLADRARFERGDLFQARFRDADVVTLYLLPRVNARLRPKLLAELRPGARVVSHGFDMGDWAPDARREVADASLYLWIVPAIAGGDWRLTLADGTALPLRLEQRFQQLSGDLGGAVLAGARLDGARLRFDARGRRFEGEVGDRTITGDGWTAERVE